MAKENTFYFQHDYNARNDRKIAPLVKDYKSCGYGIYWCTAEMMHEEGGKLEYDDITIAAIAKDLNEDFDIVSEVIDKCINKYHLFFKEDTTLSANRVRRNLDKRQEIKEGRSKAGKASAEAKKNRTNVQQMSTNVEHPLTNVQQNSTKERKGKEIKGNIYSEDFVDCEIQGIGKVRINILATEEGWQKSELQSFICNSTTEFQNIAIRKQELKIAANFQKVLQIFVGMIQEQGDYKESRELKRYFSNWLNKLNGKLEGLLSSTNKNEQKAWFI